MTAGVGPAQPHIPVVIIVSGSPGTGKTTISRYIAQTLGIPLIHRDTIKEMIFDSLGWHNRAWSQKVGMTSYQLLYYMLELLLQTRQDFIIESNFNSSLDTARFSALQQRYPFRALQVLCSTDAPVLFERLRRRSRSPERHPGHGDSEDLAALTEKDIVGTAEPLALQGPTLVLDTTDFETIDYSHLVQEIQRYRARR